MSPPDTILALLAEHGPLYGRDLARLSEGRLGRGTVYTHLAHLEDLGLVRHEVRHHRVHGFELTRHLYHITGDGWRKLLDGEPGLAPA